MPSPPKQLPDKVCAICGSTFNRRRYNGVLESVSRYTTRRHCSQACANSREQAGLAALRRRAARHRGDTCERCGATERLHAHHISGDVTDNRPENIETVCASCHISGHWAEARKRIECGSRRSYNAGCRCARCRAANAEYQRNRKAVLSPHKEVTSSDVSSGCC